MSFLSVDLGIVRYVGDAFADKLGHYGFCSVAIIDVNEEVKEDLVAVASTPPYAVGSSVFFDKGLNSCLIESRCQAADEWRLSGTKAMEI